MRRPASTSPWTWVVALLFVIGIDAILTRSPLIWEQQEVWVERDVGRTAFWQVYDVMRKLYRPRREAAVRVALLGDSRPWFAAREASVEREVARLAPGLDLRLDNLCFFGSRVGDQEIVSRLLHRLDPTLVVLAIGGYQLVPTEWGDLVNRTGRYLEVGWRDGPVVPASAAERLDRWLKTAWPLYRLRIFVRRVLWWRLFPPARHDRWPESFESRRAFFEALKPGHGEEFEGAYRAWLRDPTLERFTSFIELQAPVEQRIHPPPLAPLTRESDGLRYLDALLARLAEGPWQSFVLLFPENPLFEQDAEGRFHEPGFSDHAAALIREVAARHRIPVVDGRDWMPAEQFWDFYHVFPDFGAFPTRLAHEVVRAQSS
jgi:hypothetical protein